MGQCGCGDLRPIKAYKLTANKFIVIGYYPGCQYCEPIVGLDINFFDKKGFEIYCDNMEAEEFEFNEYGGKNCGDGLPLLDLNDFQEVLKKDEFSGDLELYENIADWMQDHGLSLVQEAIYKQVDKFYWNKSPKQV